MSKHTFNISTHGGRSNLSSGKVWEGRVGYSRAVKKGNLIAVAGTMGYDAEGNYPASPGKQTENAIRFIRDALAEFGAGLEDVIRTRIYVTNINDQGEIGAAHSSFFDGIRPAATMVEVSGLAAPEAVVEIEVEAVVS